MKSLSIILVACLLVLPGASMMGQSNKAVYGNGTIVSKDHAVKMFTSLVVETVAQVEVELQSMPYLTITTDENLLEYLKVEREGNLLRVTPSKWLKPSQRIKIKMGTAFLKYLEPQGYGVYRIDGINSTPFEVNNEVSTVFLFGETDELNLRTGKGKIDASQVKAETVNITIDGNATVTVDPQLALNTTIRERGKVVYLNEPKTITKNEGGKGVVTKKGAVKIPLAKRKPNVEFVRCDLYNNNLSFVALEIIGPNQQPFSYGSDFGPFESKKENLPVGTRIYKVNKKGDKQMILEIESSNKGNKVNLF